jgi:hypothetical protein
MLERAVPVFLRNLGSIATCQEWKIWSGERMIGVDTDALADILCWVFLAGAVIFYLLSHKSPTDKDRRSGEERQ